MKIIIFCCGDSLFKLDKYQEDIRIIHIPSIKKVDILSILSLFASGVDKIYAIPCKECLDIGKAKIGYLKKLIKEIGLSEEKLQLCENGKISY